MYDTEKFLKELFPRLMNELASKPDDLSVLSDLAYKDINDMSAEKTAEKNNKEKSLRQLLSCSLYPASSVALQRLNDLLASIELIAKCPEGRSRAFLYKNEYLNREYILKLLPHKYRTNIETLRNVKFDFPVILCESSNSSVSCMNYADNRINFTIKEFADLTNGATREGIDLNTIIKYVVIKVPMCISGVAVMFDNKDMSDSMFSDYYDGVFPGVNKNILKISEDNFKGNKKKKYYGISLRFACITDRIICFYNKQISDCDEMIKTITDDLIRLGSGNETLSEMRTELTKKRDVLENEKKDIQKKISDICNTIKKIEGTIGNTLEKITGINKACKDAVMELVIIDCESGNFEAAQKCNDTYMSDNHYYAFINGYIQSVKNNTVIPLSSLLHMDAVWQINKMTLACSDLSYVSNSELAVIRKWLKSIDGHITTAKEKYALALTYLKDSPKSTELLKESFLEGYAPAGKLLFERFNTDNNMIDFLADLIQEDADIRKGNSACLNAYFLFEPGWFWYKLAAAAGSTEAVRLMADKIYDEQVAYLPAFYSQLSEGRQKAIDALMVFCSYLIDAGISPLHYTHVLGIIYYLKKDFVLAMEKLSGANSKIANYCKGKMCANGWGVAKDLNKAQSYYSKAGDFGDAVTLYNRISNEINEKKQAEASKSTYQKTESYKSTTSNYSSSGGCFITTAAVQNLKAADDCEELELMRAFRDKYLTTSDIAQSLVLEYYKIAPEICRRIDGSDDSRSVYSYIWDNYILKSIQCIKNGNIPEAQLLYIKMTMILAQKYDVQVNSELVTKYIGQIEKQ